MTISEIYNQNKIKRWHSWSFDSYNYYWPRETFPHPFHPPRILVWENYFTPEAIWQWRWNELRTCSRILNYPSIFLQDSVGLIFIAWPVTLYICLCRYVNTLMTSSNWEGKCIIAVHLKSRGTDCKIWYIFVDSSLINHFTPGIR